MGKLLERAIEEARRLPESQQEAVGAWLLAKIESERRGDELFSRPPSETLKRMAEEALEEIELLNDVRTASQQIDAGQAISNRDAKAELRRRLSK